MTEYKYKVSQRCYRKIYSFYHHVALKYRHTYSEELMHQNIDDAIDAIIFKSEKVNELLGKIFKKYDSDMVISAEDYYSIDDA